MRLYYAVPISSTETSVSVNYAMHPSTKELMERRLDLMNPLKRRDLMCDRNGQDPCKTGCRIELPSHGHCRVYTLLKSVGGSLAMGELNTAQLQLERQQELVETHAGACGNKQWYALLSVQDQKEFCAQQR